MSIFLQGRAGASAAVMIVNEELRERRERRVAAVATGDVGRRMLRALFWCLPIWLSWGLQDVVWSVVSLAGFSNLKSRVLGVAWRIVGCGTVLC